MEAVSHYALHVYAFGAVSRAGVLGVLSVGLPSLEFAGEQI